MNVFILTYPSGGCGNFINYFINRHTSFPNPSCIGEPFNDDRKCLSKNHSLHFEDGITIQDYMYIRDNYANMALSLSGMIKNNTSIDKKFKSILSHECAAKGVIGGHPYHPRVYDNYYGNVHEWYKLYHDMRLHTNSTKKLEIPKYHSVKFMNQTFSSISFVPGPIHINTFFILFPDYIVSSSDYNYKHITIMVPNEFNRIRSDFKNHAMYFKKQMGNIRNLRKSLNVPLHVVNLQELLACDDLEYNKLLDFIEQPPLDNWKELITDYRITINY